MHEVSEVLDKVLFGHGMKAMTLPVVPSVHIGDIPRVSRLRLSYVYIHLNSSVQRHLQKFSAAANRRILSADRSIGPIIDSADIDAAQL
jgi:hypothetical protein